MDVIATFLCLTLLGRQEGHSLVEQLGSPRIEQRESAAQRLIELGAQSLTALAEGRTSSDAEIRARVDDILERLAARLPEEDLAPYPFLREIRIQREAEKLIASLAQESLRALGHFEDPADFLDRLPQYKRLAEMGKPAVASLIRAARSSELKCDVRFSVAILLGESRDPSALPVLLELLMSREAFHFSAG